MDGASQAGLNPAEPHVLLGCPSLAKPIACAYRTSRNACTWRSQFKHCIVGM